MSTDHSEEQFSPQQSFAVIQTMIETAKNQFRETGHLYLLWGWVVFICSVAQFILLSVFHYQYHYMVWTLTWLVFIYQVIYIIRRKRKERVRTYTDNIIGFVWIVFAILMLLFGVVFGIQLGENYYKVISPGFLALYGMPTFLSGIILRFKPLIIGGIGCWLLSILCVYIPYDYQLLLVSVAMLIAWIIPGFKLRAKYKKVNA